MTFLPHFLKKVALIGVSPGVSAQFGRFSLGDLKINSPIRSSQVQSGLYEAILHFESSRIRFAGGSKRQSPYALFAGWFTFAPPEFARVLTLETS